MRRWSVVVVVFGLTAAVLAACGDDGEGSASDGSEGVDGAPASEAACVPVGEGGGTEVTVTLDEWSVTAAPASVDAGTVTFDVRNRGDMPHELVVVRAASPDDLTVADGRVVASALPPGAFIGEVEEFPGGEACDGTFDLAAGSYVLFCNIVGDHDSRAASHYESGMVTTFDVR